MNTFLHNFEQLFICLDQLLNVLIFMLIGHKAWSDETLSAHAHRIAITHDRK